MPAAASHLLAPARQVRVRELPIMLAVGGVYYASAVAALYVYHTFNTSPALVWPAAGIGLAAVLLGGYRMWVPIALAQAAALLTYNPGAVTLAIASGSAYAAQAVVAAYLMRRAGFIASFSVVRTVVIFTFAAIVLTTIAPGLGTLARMALGALDVSAAYNFGRSWAAGIFSVLVVTPLAITWASSPPRRADLLPEVAAALALVGLGDYLLFWTRYLVPLGIAIIFLLPALLIWLALRLHPRWLTLAIFETAAIGLCGTLIANPGHTALSAQLIADEVYIGLVAAIFYIFIAVVEERRAAYLNLAALYADAQAADQAKNNFIAVLAHELRNPLAPILSSLEYLKLEPLAQGAHEAVDTMTESIAMMRRLLDDLLDTARLAQGRIELRLSHVRLADVVAQSVASVRDAAANRDITLTVRADVDDAALEADPVRLKQALMNLLNNACKYTEPGGAIELAAYLEGHEAVLEVRDTGIGIEPELVPTLFEPFRSGRRAAKAGTGLGIGLFLTKNLVELHNGRIEVESGGVGAGSVFRIRLPASVRVSAPAPQLQAARAGGGSRVLVVDDNEPAVKGLKRLLEHYGHEVQTAFSGSEALGLVPHFKPEVVLLDIGLPDMSGYEVARALRAEGTTCALVALTGYGQESDRQRATQAGFDLHLTKPVGIRDLTSAIAKLRGAAA